MLHGGSVGRRGAGVLLAAGLALWSSSAWAGPGRLDRVRDEVGGSSDSSSSSSSDDDGGWSSDDDGGGDSSGLGLAVAQILIEGSARIRYRPYPYADGGMGYVFWAAEGEMIRWNHPNLAC